MVLAGLTSIKSRVDESSNALELHMQQIQDSLLLNLKQLEHRFLQRVDDLSGRASVQHAESDLYMADLSSSLLDPEARDSPTPETEQGLLAGQDSVLRRKDCVLLQ